MVVVVVVVLGCFWVEKEDGNLSGRSMSMRVRGGLGAWGPLGGEGCTEWESLGVGRGCKGGPAPPGTLGYSEGESTARMLPVYSGKSCKEKHRG